MSLMFAGSAAAGLAAVVVLAGAEIQAPLVFLNHFFVVIDAESYRALQASAFVTEEWAPFEKRTTARNDQTYTGIYWYGRRTYFEVFEPESQGPLGASGLALSVDTPGGSALVKAAWAQSLGGAETGPLTRKTETDEVPWFDMTYSPAAAGGILRVWLMEYHKDFLARWYGDKTPARGITRPEVLDRYVAKIGRSEKRETALLRDVTSLRLALEPKEKDMLVRHLRPLGWTVREDGEATQLEGPEGVSLTVVPATATSRGIVEATFSLQRNVAARTEHFGRVVLELQDDRARLRF